jgi:soluble lytic murein transglycosylase
MNSKGSARFILSAVALVIILALIIVIVALKLPSIKKHIPQKDPYALTLLSNERQDLYSQLSNRAVTDKPYLQLAQSAFCQGEIYEAKYFLSRAKSFDTGYNTLKANIESYEKLNKELLGSLYDDRKFYNEPFVYDHQYKLIGQILDLSETGYVRVRHLFLKGYLLLKEGRRTEARQIFDDLRKNGGVLAETSLYLYAKTFVSDTETEEGIIAFKEYIDEHSDARLAPLASVYLATLLEKSGKLDYARDVLQLTGLAFSLEESEYIPEMLLKRESLEDKSSDESRKLLVEMFRDYPRISGVFERALEIYNGWEKGEIKLNDSELYLHVANVLVENGRYTQSKKFLDALIKTIDPKFLDRANFIYAKRDKGAGEIDSAIIHCKAAIQKTSDKNIKSQAYSLIGEIYGLKGDVANAEKNYKFAGDAKGLMGDYALREIGRIAYANGWRAKAEQYYGELVNSFPDSEYASEALNYLVVLEFYQGEKESAEKYARMLSEKGTENEDRLKGKYFLYRLGKESKEYGSENPLAYYSMIAGTSDVKFFLDPDQTYPEVNKYKDNLAWEYFLAGCWDLAEKEYEYLWDSNDPYSKMARCYIAYHHKEPSDGIRMTRDYTAGNYQSKIEKGYSIWFFEKAFPMDYISFIEKTSAERNLPSSLFLGIIRQESFFDPNARSYANAEGLMQIMPQTGKWIADQLGEGRGYDSSRMLDPRRNIEYGGWYLSHLRDLLGSETGMILAGHNGGPGNVKKWKEMFPVWETDKYLFYELIPAMQTRNFVRYNLVNKRIYEERIKQMGHEVYF